MDGVYGVISGSDHSEYHEEHSVIIDLESVLIARAYLIANECFKKPTHTDSLTSSS